VGKNVPPRSLELWEDRNSGVGGGNGGGDSTQGKMEDGSGCKRGPFWPLVPLAVPRGNAEKMKRLGKGDWRGGTKVSSGRYASRGDPRKEFATRGKKGPEGEATGAFFEASFGISGSWGGLGAQGVERRKRVNQNKGLTLLSSLCLSGS